MAEPLGLCAGEELLAGVFAGRAQEVVGGAAVAVRVLCRRWSRAEHRPHLRYRWPQGELGGIQLCLLLCLHLSSAWSPV